MGVLVKERSSGREELIRVIVEWLVFGHIPAADAIWLEVRFGWRTGSVEA